MDNQDAVRCSIHGEEYSLACGCQMCAALLPENRLEKEIRSAYRAEVQATLAVLELVKPYKMKCGTGGVCIGGMLGLTMDDFRLDFPMASVAYEAAIASEFYAPWTTTRKPAALSTAGEKGDK